ncbi:hypothetical protein IWW47_005286 [Coemansia sp. RSA 2052]|nr:hypothetical protein IWW47_005286 [Coemansia sp. RSA 2052]
MYGSLPTDLGSSLGSYTSMQSDATDLASPGSMHGAAGGNPMNMVNLPSSLYDVQIPGSPGAQQQAAAMAFAGAKGSGGGMSPAPSPLTPATAGFGLPTQFPVPSKSGTDGLSGEAMSGATGRARTYTAETSHRRTLTDESADSISNVPLLERSTFGGSSYDIEGGYPPNSAMSVDFNPQQHEHHYSLPSDIGTLLPGAGSGDGGSVLECSSQAYIDLISSYGLNQDPATVANYSMLLDSKLGSWESQHHPQQQQPQPQQQQQQPSSSLMDGIAPELTVYPPPQPQHQQQQPP